MKCAARGSLEIQDAKKTQKIAICAPSHNSVELSLQLRHVEIIGKRLVKQQYFFQMSPQYAELPPTNGWDRLVSLRHPQQISTGFTSSLRYCSDVSLWRPTNLCRILGRLLAWYTVYTFFGALAPWRNFATCKIHIASKSCVRLYCQRYCTALQERESDKLCGMVQGMEIRNFCRGRHLHSEP